MYFQLENIGFSLRRKERVSDDERLILLMVAYLRGKLLINTTAPFV